MLKKIFSADVVLGLHQTAIRTDEQAQGVIDFRPLTLPLRKIGV
jgi:hypothetical protein